MGHTCMNCDSFCQCGGDIDDFDLGPKYCLGCSCQQEEDDDWDEECEAEEEAEAEDDERQQRDTAVGQWISVPIQREDVEHPDVPFPGHDFGPPPGFPAVTIISFDDLEYEVEEEDEDTARSKAWLRENYPDLDPDDFFDDGLEEEGNE